ncbi:MAG: FMN-binding protein [Spirochaetales bacterium]|nr:MAG: FMN-binding protein [Spirochaetales bacterium]
MKEMTDKSLRLGLIGAVAALLLAVVNNFTEPKIAELRALKLQQALTVLSGGGTPGDSEESPAPGVARRWPILEEKGWILELEAVGYGGPMTVVASYDKTGAVIAARLMANGETVGFGKKAEDESYMDIFVGKGADVPVPVTKAALGGDADVVSGATITFTGISTAIAHGSSLVKEWEGQK